MCGINGIYSFNPESLSRDVIVGMNQASAHRGPDANGVVEDTHIQVGHCRLSIIDPGSGSDQPFRSADGRYTLTYNGEIYNYREIKKQLGEFTFRTDGDTEVVLCSFIKWGDSCLDRFQGMFAFAVWDHLKMELFVARDRMGIKPLYYSLTDERFIFSSSLRAILSTGLVPKKLSCDGLIDYLRYQTVHAPETIIEGIKMLMPGTCIRISESDGAVFRTWWSTVQHKMQVPSDYRKICDEVRSRLTESVKRRLVADVPFGAFLSGGVDSSVIVALMSQIQERKAETFSVVFKEEAFSEVEFSRLIAKKYQTNHHEIELSADEFKESIPEALSFVDHPSGDGPNTYVVSKKTRQAGVKMALSGLGGDELFCGYPVFGQMTALQSKKWLLSFPDFLRHPAGGIYHRIRRNIESAKISAVLHQPSYDLQFIYPFSRQVLMDDQITKIVRTKDLPVNSVFEICKKLIGYKTEGWRFPLQSRISLCEMHTYMQNVLLRDADQMSMACGLEVRVPFLDHELVEFVLAVEDRHKINGRPKKLLIDACSDLIPPEIYNRKKMGFILPYQHWMKNELAEFCKTRLDELNAIPDIVPGSLDTLWNQFLSGNKRLSWSRIWPLVVLGNWMKQTGVNG